MPYVEGRLIHDADSHVVETPGWLDAYAEADVRARLPALNRVTPYPTEDAGWVVEQIGPEVCMFSPDYLHVEGGRNSLARFDASLEGADADARRRFFSDNFVDLMGSAMARVPQPATA